MKTGVVNGLAIGLAGLLSACVYQEPPLRRAYHPPPPAPPVYPAPVDSSVYQAPPDWDVSASFEIRAEADFQEPLALYGGWIEVESYGRCWRPSPAHLPGAWYPYANGHWVWTDCGWYWVSNEPWAWACYHYGSWVRHPIHEWIWVPGVEWAPAWVTWRSGGGYVGWAPAPPRGVVITAPAPPFVFVHANRFHELVRPTTVIVNNTTIINQTTVINNVRQETRSFGSAGTRRVTVNEGPGVASIERATGRKLRAVPVHEAVRQTPIPAPVQRRILEQKNKNLPPANRIQPRVTPQRTPPPGPNPQTTPVPGRTPEVTPAPEPLRESLPKRAQPPETKGKGKSKADEQKGMVKPSIPEQPQVAPRRTPLPGPNPQTTPAPNRTPQVTPTPEPRGETLPKRGQLPETKGTGKSKTDEEQKGKVRPPSPSRTPEAAPSPERRQGAVPDNPPSTQTAETKGKGKGKGKAKEKGKAPEPEKDDRKGKP